MIGRSIWTAHIEELWTRRPLVWLSGVRRIGKTVLAKQLPGITYYNCDLPSVQRQMADPEYFLHNQQPGARLVFDEIHRLDDPSSLLKIAADEFPHLAILATGSSTLAATRKFRDSLSGRKHSVHLTPVLWRERASFGVSNLDTRLLKGGFPERLSARDPDPQFFEEWTDSFFARDIQELFGVRNRMAFIALLRLLLLRSGGQLEVTDLCKEVGSSRPTVLSHLDAMEIAHAITRLPPFHGGGHREIVRQPKVYGFDTGIIAHIRGWSEVRDSDRGHLWEHLVLDELRTASPQAGIRYWRDKTGREIDFVLPRPDGRVDTYEAKVTPDAWNGKNLSVFREIYPKGKDFLVCPHVGEPYDMRSKGRSIRVCSGEHL